MACSVFLEASDSALEASDLVVSAALEERSWADWAVESAASAACWESMSTRLPEERSTWGGWGARLAGGLALVGSEDEDGRWGSRRVGGKDECECSDMRALLERCCEGTYAWQGHSVSIPGSFYQSSEADQRGTHIFWRLLRPLGRSVGVRHVGGGFEELLY